MTSQLTGSVGPCCRDLATDAAHSLVRFARELGMSTMLVTASEGGRRLGLSSVAVAGWLEGVAKAAREL